MSQARKLSRSRPTRVRICWDLDNTLVDSGSLLRSGSRLQEAVVDAEPVPNMLEFVRAIRIALPAAEHVIVSARRRAMRKATNAWVRRYGIGVDDRAICFVPDAWAKIKVWEELARGASLLIVDDLSYGHEGASPIVYEELVVLARRTAAVYLGMSEIAEVVADPHAATEVVARVLATLGTSRPDQSSHPGGPAAARLEQRSSRA